MNQKAQWHLELNGGLIPVLENPQGDLIIESSVVMSFACEYKPEGGVDLIPKDPFVAAKMRIAMIKFEPLMG